MTRRRHHPKPEPPPPTEWQARALRDLTDIASRKPDLVRILEEPHVDDDGSRLVHVSICTEDLPARAAKGVRFQRYESFWIHLGENGDQPPPVYLDHWRFLGVSHVMSGFQLCLHLDPSRDWAPDHGIRGLMEQLWTWMEDAAADRFHPDEAMYHAVGGVLHVTPGTPTVVVRELADSGQHLDEAFLTTRSANRLDLCAQRSEPEDLHVPLVRLRRDIPIGAGRDVLADLLYRLEATQGLQGDWPHDQMTTQSQALFRRPRPLRLTVSEYAVTGHFFVDAAGRLPPVVDPWHLRSRTSARTILGPVKEPAVELAAALVASATQNPMGSDQYAVLTVPHPSGGPRHLLCLRLEPAIADHFRHEAATPGRTVNPYKVVQHSPRMPMEWCRLSDERPQVTKRRDTGRPTASLLGRNVHVLGTGGLGSWIAEFVVRSGARRVVLHDPGHITGGLLVRQNFTELDIGDVKHDALARRLRSIRDDVQVVLFNALEHPMEDLLAADLVVDATISGTVSRSLDSFAKHPDRTATFAQVATDARTGTLGLVHVLPTTPSHSGATPGSETLTSSLVDLDRNAREQSRKAPELEAYTTFWAQPLPGDEFVPTRGCSVPTFHGSAADMAAIAGTLLNFITLHLGSREAGSHLLSLPQSGVSPAHRFLPAAPSQAEAESDVA